MQTSKLIGIIGAGLYFALVGTAQATTIGFVPDAQTGDVGDIISYDIVVSELGGEIVSAYDLDILYEESVLSGISFSFSDGLGVPGIEAFVSDGFGPGTLDVASLSLLSDADLLALQGGDTVNLGEVSFQVIGEGETQISFVFDAFNDIKGANNQVLDVVGDPGFFSTRGEAAIPEPTSAVVFAVGLMIVGAYVRR